MQLHGRRQTKSWIGMLAVLGLGGIPPAYCQPRQIDTAKSVITVRVYKTGMLSALGHDHEISAPLARGTVDPAGRKVELRVRAAALRVLDAKLSAKDRAGIQSTMLGPQVLDAENHQEIVFHSTTAEAAGAGAWKVSGELSVRGETRPVSMEVTERDGHYAGTCRFKLTEFGIKPIKAAGGTVRVKDEVQVEFDVQLLH